LRNECVNVGRKEFPTREAVLNTAVHKAAAEQAPCGNDFDFTNSLKHFHSATTFPLTKPLNAQTVKKTQQN
jgi:hypothetical protein